MEHYAGPAALHCQSTDLEERFGRAKFGERWIGRQTEADLLLLARVRDASRDWQSFDLDDSSGPPLYVGPAGNQEVADAIERALRRKRQLAQVRERFSLLDRLVDDRLFEFSDDEFDELFDTVRIVFSDDELKKRWDASKIASIAKHMPLRRHLETCFAQHEDGLPPASLDSEHDKWLKQVLDHLSACREVRAAIGWDEITERIDPSWLRAKGFGPATPVDIGALRGKLIGEALPRTSGPPKPAFISTGVDGVIQVPTTNQPIPVMNTEGAPGLLVVSTSHVPTRSKEDQNRKPRAKIMTGPVPKKAEAAKKKIRDGVREGKFTIEQLVVGARAGGFKQERVAELLGFRSHSRAMEVVRELAEELEQENLAAVRREADK